MKFSNWRQGYDAIMEEVTPIRPTIVYSWLNRSLNTFFRLKKIKLFLIKRFCELINACILINLLCVLRNP